MGSSKYLGTSKSEQKTRTMPSLNLHIVLLFAVAYSQIFGGVSCCCLSRTIFASLSPTHETASATQAQTSAIVPFVPKCPKCAASQVSARQSPQGDGYQLSSVSQCNKCQCTKTVSSATVHAEPRSLSIAVNFIATFALSGDLIPRAESSSFQRHEITIRFGDNSWQSIACHWKK